VWCTQEVETGRWRVQGQSEIHSKTLSQKTKQGLGAWLKRQSTCLARTILVVLSPTKTTTTIIIVRRRGEKEEEEEVLRESQAEI
jgi:hypothetical protein